MRRRECAEDLTISLAMPGRHNILNALAAVAVAADEGISDRDIQLGLESFSGVSRRFEVHGRFASETGEFLLVDDYGHHPREVRATIEAVRNGWPEARLVMVYQPHRYTRTMELFDQFVDALSLVDRLVLLGTYAAGEEPIEGASANDLYKQLQLHSSLDCTLLGSIDEVPAELEAVVRAGDVVLTQGAGQTAKLANNLKERWEDRRLSS